MKHIRATTGMTQKEFAEYFNIPLKTLQKWEQGERTPPRYVTELIKYKINKEETNMNKTIKKAAEIMEGEYVRDIPNVDIGDEVRLADIWDGEGDIPEDSYSYKIADEQWINYEFEVIEENEDTLDTVVKITDIELL